MKQIGILSLCCAFVAALSLGGKASAEPNIEQLAATPGTQPIVVELFTSQGCSSCPPADAYLGKLAKRDDVLALSFHVDYWDYIGWKDPYADPVHGDRQRKYSKKFRLRYVYTPQMIIQGAFEVTGSDRHQVEKAIEQSKSLTQIPVHLAWQDKDHLQATIGGTGTHERARLWAVAFDHSHTTEILRGENRGETLTYTHVVRSLVNLGEWSGAEEVVTIPRKDLDWSDRYGIAVIVQSEQTGRIFGTSVIMPTSNQAASR